MSVKLRISTVTLNSGEEVEFPDSGVTVVVGPNNSGKSSLLREIFQIVQNGLQNTNKSRVILTGARFTKSGDQGAHGQFLEQHTRAFSSPDGNTYLRSLEVNVTQVQAASWWTGFPGGGLHSSAFLYCRLADTLSRLTITSPPSPVNLLTDALSHPIHVLQDDDAVEMRFSEYLKAAFGQDLILNRGAGSTLPLHMGQRPLPSPGEDRVSKNYLKALSGVPLVHEQGDGIKSFVGCLLSAIAMNRFITLVDEPEAFLHPPQAKMLGNLLAREQRENQLLVATHSGDVLRGLLDGAGSQLNVLRITRKQNKNYVNRLEPNEIKGLWSDPILRFSNILDGLFHEAVVLCESDSDCRFFSAVLSVLTEERRWPDVMFASSGGKDRMPVILRALRKIKVPIHVAADFDLLTDERKAQEVFESLGGEWRTVASDYKQVAEVLERKTPPLSANQVIERIRGVLSSVEKTQQWTEDSKELIRVAMKSTSSWATAKELGKVAIPSGAPTAALDRLLAAFEDVGIFLVPSGELESFDKTVGMHGPRWVAKVLEKNLSSTDFAPAREYVKKLCSFEC